MIEMTDIGTHPHQTLEWEGGGIKMSKLPQWVNTLLFLLLLLIVAFALLILDVLDSLPLYQQYIILGICLGIGMLALIPYFIIRMRKARVISEDQDRLQKERNSVANEIDPEQSILYLRPFKADANEVHAVKHGGHKTIHRSKFKKFNNSFDNVRYNGKTYSNIEELICEMLKGKGIPVAIGDPNEAAMGSGISIGAQRVYETDETWKDKVDFFLTRSKMVILYVDFTDGVMWEIDRAINQYQDKVVFVPRLYNKRNKVLEFLSVIDVFFILLSPIYHIKYKTFVFPRLRRGCAYYKDWRKTFGFDINDKICAVRIIDGEPVLYQTSTGLIEDQLEAIHSAITEYNNMKGCNRPMNVKAISLPAELTGHSFYRARLFALGSVSFSPEGIKFHSTKFAQWTLKRDLLNKYIWKYQVGQPPIKYDDIVDVLPFKSNCLELITDRVNGSYYFSVPYSQSSSISDISSFIQRCRDEGFDRAVQDQDLFKKVESRCAKARKAMILPTIILMFASLAINWYMSALVGAFLAIMTPIFAKQSGSRILYVISIVLMIAIIALTILLFI